LIDRSKDSSDLQVQKFCEQLASLHELKQKIEQHDPSLATDGTALTVEQVEKL
jgi:hypothetical protein